MPQSATGQGGAFARPLAAGQLSAWRINLNKPRVFSIYKFSSLPRAISAATAMANWASSSSEDGLDDVLRRLEELTAAMRERSARYEAADASDNALRDLLRDE